MSREHELDHPHDNTANPTERVGAASEGPSTRQRLVSISTQQPHIHGTQGTREYPPSPRDVFPRDEHAHISDQRPMLTMRSESPEYTISPTHGQSTHHTNDPTPFSGDHPGTTNAPLEQHQTFVGGHGDTYVVPSNIGHASPAQSSHGFNAPGYPVGPVIAPASPFAVHSNTNQPIYTAEHISGGNDRASPHMRAVAGPSHSQPSGHDDSHDAPSNTSHAPPTAQPSHGFTAPGYPSSPMIAPTSPSAMHSNTNQPIYTAEHISDGHDRASPHMRAVAGPSHSQASGYDDSHGFPSSIGHASPIVQSSHGFTAPGYPSSPMIAPTSPSAMHSNTNQPIYTAEPISDGHDRASPHRRAVAGPSYSQPSGHGDVHGVPSSIGYTSPTSHSFTAPAGSPMIAPVSPSTIHTNTNQPIYTTEPTSGGSDRPSSRMRAVTGPSHSQPSRHGDNHGVPSNIGHASPTAQSSHGFTAPGHPSSPTVSPTSPFAMHSNTNQPIYTAEHISGGSDRASSRTRAVAGPSHSQPASIRVLPAAAQGQMRQTSLSVDGDTLSGQAPAQGTQGLGVRQPLPPLPHEMGRRDPTGRARTTENNSPLAARSGIDWIVPVEEKLSQRTIGERLEPTLTTAIAEKNKYAFKAKATGYALNAAIGLQVLLGALTTGLSAVTTGRQTSIMTAILGGLATIVASYLARARGSNEPELSITRVKDLEQFIRECEAFQMDCGLMIGGVYDEQLENLRRRFEELLGNANGERKLSPPV